MPGSRRRHPATPRFAPRFARETIQRHRAKPDPASHQFAREVESLCYHVDELLRERPNVVFSLNYLAYLALKGARAENEGAISLRDVLGLSRERA